MPRALITGITGQDGSYLARSLANKGYEIIGTHRSQRTDALAAVSRLGPPGSIELRPLDLRDSAAVDSIVRDLEPDEIYNLAAISFVPASFDDPCLVADTNGIGPVRVLEAVRRFRPNARVFQASSSQMFGLHDGGACSEVTPFSPANPYAVAKLFAHNMAGIYRQVHGIFCCSGILFNHESPLRPPSFATRKIVRAAVRLRTGNEELTLGNLEARRDWGFAGDYVEAMQAVLQIPEPDDFVLATGIAHSVRDLVEVAFGTVGLDFHWEGTGLNERAVEKGSGRILARVTPEHFRPAEAAPISGDPSRAHARLGWKADTNFAELIALMVRAEVSDAA